MEGTNDETTVLIPPENKHSGVDGIDNNDEIYVGTVSLLHLLYIYFKK